MRLVKMKQLRLLQRARTATVITVLALIAGAGACSSASASPKAFPARLAVRLAASSTPEVGNVAPATGPASGGTAVLIGGSNFTGATAVDFGANAASFSVKAAGRIEAIAPPGAESTVDVTVTTAEGTSAISRFDHYSYVPAGPSVIEVLPDEGDIEGGRIVKIVGAHFEGVAGVSFGESSAAFHVSSPEVLSVTTPPGPAPLVDVRVSTAEGTSPVSPADHYRYTSKPIEISKVTPNKGPALGGTLVDIAGEEFFAVTDVKFGAVSASSFTVNPSGHAITAVAPSHTAESVTISVLSTFGPSEYEYCPKNRSGRQVCAVRDSYKYQEPTVASVTPNSGPRAGGTGVSVTGSGFGLEPGETELLFGKTPATSVSCASDTTCTAVSPATAKAGFAYLKVIVHSLEPKTSKKNPAVGFHYE